MEPEEARDILFDMRDQHLQFIDGTENTGTWGEKFLKEAWACDFGAKASEKQIPKKVDNLSEMYMDFGERKKIKVGAYGNCPNCNYNIDIVGKYCTRCGQTLDWSEENDI